MLKVLGFIQLMGRQADDGSRGDQASCEGKATSATESADIGRQWERRDPHHTGLPTGIGGSKSGVTGMAALSRWRGTEMASFVFLIPLRPPS